MTEFETKDSGQRAEYSSGMVRDTNEGKPRFDLLHPANWAYKESMLYRWAMLMARGAQKYNSRNWEKASGVEELERFKESAFRHFFQWFSDESDEDHAAAVFFNIQAYEFTKWKLSVSDLSPAEVFEAGKSYTSGDGVFRFHCTYIEEGNAHGYTENLDFHTSEANDIINVVYFNKRFPKFWIEDIVE